MVKEANLTKKPVKFKMVNKLGANGIKIKRRDLLFRALIEMNTR